MARNEDKKAGGTSRPFSLQRFSAPVWRILPKYAVATPAMPAQAPEGRFHHSGQIAAYASLSAEGAAVAIKRYLVDDVERVLVPMHLDDCWVVDYRGDPALSVVWQDIRAVGENSPTWQYSDRARKLGAQAMLYSSRSRPDLGHVVVFEPALLRIVGAVTDIVQI